ncbi:MAG: LLM class flavin-dependent oxidoreductase [Actinomycetota bacterium]|nr:LLM class flavin-dependent oxidoreductase [Actinomycetota bacterium]
MVVSGLSRVGIVVNRVSGVETVLQASQGIENLGYGAAWLTNGGPEDCMPLLAALALRCPSLRLGTSVVQTYPRHPAVLAAEANVVDQLAPGRLRLGVGPSHAAVMALLGLPHTAPFEHLTEYVDILRSLFAGQAIDFHGEHFQVRTGLGRVVTVAVMVGALQPRTFELAGARADGAITWLCPAAYLARHAVPALTRGADGAGRPRPPLVAHLAVCVSERAGPVRDAVRAGVPNIAFPAYQQMLIRAGFDEAAGGIWTDHLVDHVIAWGTPERVAERIQEMFSLGADEVLLRPLPLGDRHEDPLGEIAGALSG